MALTYTTPFTERFYPIAYNANERRDTILENAFNIIYRDEIITRTKGYETLEFDIPMRDRARNSILPEHRLEFGDKFYIIKLINDGSDGITHVSCVASWYELGQGGDFYGVYSTTETISEMAFDIVNGHRSYWIQGTVENKSLQGATFKENSRLYNLRLLAKLSGTVLSFKQIRQESGRFYNLTYVGSELGKEIFHTRTNIQSIQRTIDTRKYITRYTLYGKDGLDCASINGNNKYVEDYAWSDSMGMPRFIRQETKHDERFTIKQNILNTAKEYLKTWSRPIVTYEIEIALFLDIPELNTMRRVVDEEMGVNDNFVITQRELNYSEPAKSRITLSDPRSNLVDLFNDEEDV